MKNTLENWYSSNKITAEQYYQLIDLVNAETAYTLSELTLLASLPRTDNLPNPPDELTRFRKARDWWAYEESLSDWIDDEPKPNFLLSKEFFLLLALITVLLIILTK